jgi:outer membrane lipoprotein-sorting protein
MLELAEAIYSREEMVEGRNTKVYVIFSKEPKKTRRVAKETLWIDSKEFIPVKYVQQDKSGKIILSALYKDIILNLDLDDKLFMKFKKVKRNPQLSFSF